MVGMVLLHVLHRIYILHT